jgi:NADPH:quinone reductase-like Zn-dependent oxidoreductase
VIDRVYPLEEVRLAHEQSEGGHAKGKIVLRID